MKKILILPLMLFLVCFVSCAGKKDRLTADTLVMTVEPPIVFVVGLNTRTTMTVITHDASGATNAEINPVWSVADSSLGYFSPTQGKTVTFISTHTGSTTLIAQYGAATATSSCNISN